MGIFVQRFAEPQYFVLGRVVDLVGLVQSNHLNQTHMVEVDDRRAAVLAARLKRLRAIHNLCWL